MESDDPKRPSRSLNIKSTPQGVQMLNPFKSHLIAIIFSISLLLTSCKKDLQTAVVMFQPNSLQTAEQTPDFLDRLSRKVKPDLRFVIHLLKGNQVSALYGNVASGRRSILELHSQIDPNPSTPQLEVIPSDDQALVQAFQIAKEEAIKNSGLRSIYIYFVTPCTNNPSTLAEIHKICENLAEAMVPNVHLYLVGLAPEYRIAMANAIAPMGKHSRSAGTNDSEWIQLLNELN